MVNKGYSNSFKNEHRPSGLNFMSKEEIQNKLKSNNSSSFEDLGDFAIMGDRECKPINN